MIVAADDSLHDSGGEVYWNESSWFPISIPDRLTSGWVMLFHRPNMGISVGGVALWDPTGDRPHQCLHYDWGDLYAFEPASDMFDCKLPNGLQVSLTEPLREIALTYDSPECQLDLRWRATGEPFHSRWSEGAQGWGSGHFEQAGRIIGTITVNGEQIPVDAPSTRDRSWGPRTPKKMPRADFPWGLCEDGDGFHVFVVATEPAATDPVNGTTEKLLFGWQRLAGETRPLTAATRRIVDRGPDGRPLRIELRGRDESGRDFTADGECVNWLQWQGYPFTFQWWCMVRWAFDGREAWGELQEFAPLELTRRLHRKRRQVSA